MTDSIPTVSVKRLSRAFIDEHRLGPVTRLQAKARIEHDAAFARDRQLASIQRASIPYAERGKL